MGVCQSPHEKKFMGGEEDEAEAGARDEDDAEAVDMVCGIWTSEEEEVEQPISDLGTVAGTG